MPGRDVYAKTIHIGGAAPRDAEILAFGLCNARLTKCHDKLSRIDALNKTHQLWSILIRDLSNRSNALPERVKQELIGLGFWAMGYSIAAMGRDLSVQPLIDVNQNIMEGLQAQCVTLAPPVPQNASAFVAGQI
jgi:flagellar protein FlaF